MSRTRPKHRTRLGVSRNGSSPGVDVCLVGGARPNFVKLAALYDALKRQDRLDYTVVHTGQHHDFEMSQAFFEDLELPPARIFLGANTGTHAVQTARIMVKFETLLDSLKPKVVVVVGDVNSTLACTLAAVKKGVRVAHVEAGLRSFDRTMPEEINRIVTDSISHILYTTCRDGTRNLIREGVDKDRIHEFGNVMIDTLLRYRPKAMRLRPTLPPGVEDGSYVLVTMHRPSNVDSREGVGRAVELLRETAKVAPVVFPMHPRTQRTFRQFGLMKHVENGGIHVMPPLRYLGFLRLLLGAAAVMTDSGGIQEETTALGLPCVTLRENTERPVTVDIGTNLLLGVDPDRVPRAMKRAIEGRWKTGRVPKGWDGHAADRIVAHLAREVKGS